MIKEIKNLKLKEFIKNPPEEVDQYLMVLNYIDPIPTKRKVFDMKLKHVEYIKKNLFKNNDESLIEIISKVQKVDHKEVLNFGIIKFFGLVNSVIDQIEQIAKAEENSLSSNEVNIKWEIVEGDKALSKFGILNTLDALSNENILMYDKILNLPYSRVFSVLLMRKTTAELKIKMDKINLDL